MSSRWPRSGSATDAETRRLALERCAQAAVADDRPAAPSASPGERGERLEQQIETLLPLEPADGADDDRPEERRAPARIRSRFAGSRRNASGSMPFRITVTGRMRAGANQRSWMSVETAIDARESARARRRPGSRRSARGRLAGPAVRRRERNRAGRREQAATPAGSSCSRARGRCRSGDRHQSSQRRQIERSNEWRSRTST